MVFDCVLKLTIDCRVSPLEKPGNACCSVYLPRRVLSGEAKYEFVCEVVAVKMQDVILVPQVLARRLQNNCSHLFLAHETVLYVDLLYE